VHVALEDELKGLFSERQEAAWELIAGYKVQAFDAWPQECRAAETPEDQGAM
jgi:hypothetical protein